jgi:hypothetical protein
MRFVATLVMILAWLAYGTMSAWAGCPMCASAATNAAVAIPAAAHQHMPGMDMGKSTQPSPVKDPCSTGGMVHMPFCSVCMIAPPADIGAADSRAFAPYRPLPAPEQALPGVTPQPVAPPPRLA